METNTEIKQEELQEMETPSLDEAPEKLDQGLEEAMMQLQQEEAYIQHQCQNELNNFLGMVGQEAVQEVILNTLIKAGLTSREKVAQGIQKYTVGRLEDFQKQVYATHDELLKATTEELPDLDIRLKSVEIMKDMVDEYLQVISKPIDETLKEVDKAKEEPANVVPFTKE